MSKKDRNYDLVCFDLDGTLIEEANGDILWERICTMIHGTKQVTIDRHEAYKRGELKIDDWCDIDLGEWKSNNITKDVLLKEARHSRLNPGVKETLAYLRDKGFKLAVISGSTDILLEAVYPDHPFDVVMINKIYFDESGKIAFWEKTDYGNGRKDEALKKIANDMRIPVSRTIFVGDHLNDVPAARIAGLSIAFRSKVKELEDACDVVIKENDMREILKYLE